jgi:hypothetical protein
VILYCFFFTQWIQTISTFNLKDCSLCRPIVDCKTILVHFKMFLWILLGFIGTCFMLMLPFIKRVHHFKAFPGPPVLEAVLHHSTVMNKYTSSIDTIQQMEEKGFHNFAEQLHSKFGDFFCTWYLLWPCIFISNPEMIRSIASLPHDSMKKVSSTNKPNSTRTRP